jgi:DnaJ family protein C protein 8
MKIDEIRTPFRRWYIVISLQHQGRRQYADRSKPAPRSNRQRKRRRQGLSKLNLEREVTEQSSSSKLRKGDAFFRCSTSTCFVVRGVTYHNRSTPIRALQLSISHIFIAALSFDFDRTTRTTREMRRASKARLAIPLRSPADMSDSLPNTTTSSEAKPTDADADDKNADKSNNNHTTDTDDWKIQRDACKLQADQAFQSADYASAIHHYTAALSVDPDFCVAYSNRSAAYLRNGEKSKALQDANQCIALGGMPAKGYSRQAAALQALGRWEAALESWKQVIALETQNAAAVKGVHDCQLRVQQQQEQLARDKPQGDDDDEKDPGDDLDDFFNDVEVAAALVKMEKTAAAQPQATDAIKNQKKSLGTPVQQIERLLQTNYQWRNLNPFHVLDVPHTATAEEISRRYKGLSLLLHPDKNQTEPRAQEAYDEVLKAKAMLDDELKATHCRQLVEKGMIRGQAEYDKLQKSVGPRPAANGVSLPELQSKAVQRIFADIEHKRREIERRERRYEQRTQKQEDEEEQKEINGRKFDKEWKQEDRVDKRIGNWRDFEKKKKPKL